MTARARQWIAQALVAVYFHAAWWAVLLREESGAVGDVKQQFGASAAFTMTLASLASSATWVAGVESTAITSGDVVDYLIGGKVTTGTSPTVSTLINLYVYAGVNDTPLYPDVLDGTDSAETFTSVNVRTSAIVWAASSVIDADSDRTYWFKPFSLAALFGGVIPKNWGLFLAHNTAVNLNATGGNHALYYTPVYFNVAQS
jgi:hypothetical protein